jgi:hypothetical protein
MLPRVLNVVHLDFAPRHRPPSGLRVVLATIVSLVGSLAANRLIVIVFQAAFPATKGYPHYRLGDYGKLTIIGVLIACAAWPVVTRITSEPRWMFSRMAVLVTLALFLPDAYILVNGQPGQAVAGLLLMHVAIALVTYHALVQLAPVRARRPAPSRRAQPVRP